MLDWPTQYCLQDILSITYCSCRMYLLCKNVKESQVGIFSFGSWGWDFPSSFHLQRFYFSTAGVMEYRKTIKYIATVNNFRRL
jgi:hypothetical protein